MTPERVQHQLSRGRQAMQGAAAKGADMVDSARAQVSDGYDAGVEAAANRRAGQTVFDNIGENVRGLGYSIMVLVMVGFMIYYVGNLDAANNSTLVADLITSGGDALTLIAGLFALLGLALIMRYVFAFLSNFGGGTSRT